MPRETANNREAASNRELISASDVNKHVIREFDYSFRANGAEFITINTDFNPARQSWTMHTVFAYFKESASNQNIYSQNDGDFTGRIWAMVRATNKLSSFFGGSFRDSDYEMQPGRFYDIFVSFDLDSYDSGANEGTGTLHYNIDGQSDNTFNDVVVSDANGTHLMMRSKASGYVQEGLTCRAELFTTALTDAQMLDIVKNDMAFRDKQENIIASAYNHRLLFGEGTGTLVADDSGNNNGATLSAARWSNKVPSKAREVVS